MTSPSPLLVQLVDYALSQRFETFDEQTIKALNTFVQDSLGVGICGSRVPFATALTQLCNQWGKGKEAQVFNTGEWLPAPSAAMVNAWQIHNQEFDCVHEKAVVHPMAVILAVLLAFSQRQGNVSGKQFLTAICVAVDVATTLGSATRSGLTFFRPAWCGAFGAVTGMAWLAGLDREQTIQAMGIVYSMLGGTMQAHVEGTSMLAMQIGVAARTAVNAFDLAVAGLDGPVNILDGKFGFFSIIERESDLPTAMRELQIAHRINQVSHKPFPTGRACHGGLDALQVLIQRHNFSHSDIDSVTLFAPPLINRLIGRRPTSQMAVSYARLCFAYCAATLFIDNDVTVDCYDEHKLRDPKRLSLADKITVTLDNQTDPNAMNPQQIVVKLSDGRVYRHDIPATLGSPERPLSREQHISKFIRCCKAAANPLNNSQIQLLINTTNALETLNNIDLLLPLSLPGNHPEE